MIKQVKDDKIIYIIALALAIVFILFCICIDLISAVNIFSGDSYVLNLTEDYDSYSIVGNKTEVDLEIIGEYPNYVLEVGKYSQQDSFTLIFFNKDKVVIEYYSSGGGGGGGSGRIIYRDRNITDYEIIDKTTEVPRETITSTKIIETNKIPTWIIITLIILGILILFFIIKLITDYCGVVNVNPGMS